MITAKYHEMMKTIYKFLAAMPLAIMAGCAGEAPVLYDTEEGEEQINMLMAVLPPALEAGEDAHTASEAECAYSTSNLYIGSFDTDGTLKDYFLDAGVENADQSMKAKFFEANWGPTMSVHLQKSKYSSEFLAAAFSVPSNCGSFSFAKLADNHASRTINWPGTSNNYVFTPADDETNNIPMAGNVAITAEYIDDGYFRTPDIQMTRAMAKIIIEDPEQIIGTATLKTPNKGYLWPATSDWLSGSSTMAPAVPSGVTMYDQTLTEDKAVMVKDKNGDDVRAFVFYTYEQSFLNMKADNAARRVIELTANADSGLKDNAGEPRKTTVAIAPYSEGKPDASLTAAELMTKDNGAWQGVMRNHIYTFTVQPPQQMGLFITVHVKNWDYKKINTEL